MLGHTYFRTTFTGELTSGGRPIACPYCRATRGLIVQGFPGDEGRLSHCGREFPFPRGWDARQALINAIADVRRVRTG